MLNQIPENYLNDINSLLNRRKLTGKTEVEFAYNRDDGMLLLNL